MRGLVRSMMALIVPPFPAASRPSKTTMARSPLLFDPFLQHAQLALQARQLLLVLLSLHLLRFILLFSRHLDPLLCQG